MSCIQISYSVLPVIVLILLAEVVLLTTSQSYASNGGSHVSPAPFNLHTRNPPLRVPVIKGRIPYHLETDKTVQSQPHSHSVTQASASRAPIRIAAPSAKLNIVAPKLLTSNNKAAGKSAAIFKDGKNQRVINKEQKIIAKKEARVVKNYQTAESNVAKNVQVSSFPLDELVNAIAEAAIAGHIPFTKLKLNSNSYGKEPLQIPILLLRADDLFRTTGHKINFKLINAKPISIPMLEDNEISRKPIGNQMKSARPLPAPPKNPRLFNSGFQGANYGMSGTMGRPMRASPGAPNQLRGMRSYGGDNYVLFGNNLAGNIGGGRSRNFETPSTPQANQIRQHNHPHNFGRSPAKIDVMKIIPAPKLDQLPKPVKHNEQHDSDDTLRDENHHQSHAEANRGSAVHQTHQTHQSHQTHETHQSHHDNKDAQNEEAPLQQALHDQTEKQHSHQHSDHIPPSPAQQGFSTLTYDTAKGPRKRTKPIIKIKPEGPPKRVNALGAPIKMKSEKMIKTHKMTKLVNKELHADDHHSQAPIDDAHYDSQDSKAVRTSKIPDKYLKGMPSYKREEDIRAVPFPKSNSPSESSIQDHGDHEHKSNVNAAFSKSGQPSKSLNFESIFRKDADEGSRASTSSNEENSSNHNQAGDMIAELEKNSYDKQLVKTLKNLMATTAKRHKLNFENDKDGSKKTEKNSGDANEKSESKIPEKYLKPFGSSDNQEEITRQQEFEHRVNQQKPYQHYEQAQSNSNGVAKFDPNYEYLPSTKQSVEENDAAASDLNENPSGEVIDSIEPVASGETSGPNKKRVKTFVLTGMYRKKVNEVVHTNNNINADESRPEESKRVEVKTEPENASTPSCTTTDELDSAATQNEEEEEESPQDEDSVLEDENSAAESDETQPQEDQEADEDEEIADLAQADLLRRTKAPTQSATNATVAAT